jgi:hypothetical protein
MTPKAGKRRTAWTSETSLADELDKVGRDRDNGPVRLSVQPAPAVAGVGCAHYKSTIATVLSASSGRLAQPNRANIAFRCKHLMKEWFMKANVMVGCGLLFKMQIGNDEPKNTVAQWCLNLSNSSKQKMFSSASPAYNNVETHGKDHAHCYRKN